MKNIIARLNWLTMARLLLGLILLLSGINGLVGVVPLPPMPGPAAGFMQALASTGYFFPLLHGLELAVGLLLVAGRMVPLALLAFAPLLINIAAFHVFLAPAGLPIVAIMVATYLPLLWSQRQALAGLRWRSSLGPARYLLAAVFIVSGLLGLTGHTPPPSNGWAADFLAGLSASGYMLPLLSVVQLAGGVLLAAGFVPLGLAMLTPVLVHVLAFRLIVATPRMLLVVVALILAAGWLAWVNREAWRPLVRRQVPAAACG